MTNIVEQLAKEAMETHKYFRLLPRLLAALCKLMGKAPLLKTTLIYVIEHREVELVPNYMLYPYKLVFMVLEVTLHATRGIK